MLRAVIDANIFYSAFQRDLLWNLVVLRVFQPKWTLKIETEWTGNLLANRPDLSEDRINRTKLLLRRHGWDWQITGKSSTDSIPKLPDENDQHVLNAAIQANAEVIVTSNIKDFPAALMSEVNIKALTLDEFLCVLENVNPNDVRQGLRSHLSSLQPFHVTTSTYSEMLIKNKLVMFRASVLDELNL